MTQRKQTLSSELLNTFELLRGHCGVPGVLEYFFDLTEKYFSFSAQKKRNEVLIVGSSFPEELLWANHIFPHWVIGGGLSVGADIDSRVPRDADSVSRSVFGYLDSCLTDSDNKTPVIIPITGDNQRKIAYLLHNEGRNVITVDIPPELEPSKLYNSLSDQLSTIMSDLTFKWNIPGESKKLKRASQAVAEAKATVSAVISDSKLNMSGMLKMFLLNTYFYTEDLTEWSGNLKKLAEELKAVSPQVKAIKKKPGVLIAGSPILFPNYKVPLLLENSGLSILGACDSISGKVLNYDTKPLNGSRNTLLRKLVKQTYDNDCSGAFVSNNALYDQASHLLDTLDVQGVIFHIIKGQIEYDFELERMEKLFAKHKLPVFRLETDYHDNDVEQLRIRLEAFAELLAQDIKI